MGAYKKLPGEEQQMRGAFSVQCPECGAPLGFACRNPKGKRPVRLTQGPQRACVRSSIGPSLGCLILTRTARSRHISPTLEPSSLCIPPSTSTRC
jgi:hypothetical protein